MHTPNVLSVDLEFWLSRITEPGSFPHRDGDKRLSDAIFEETVIRPAEQLLEIFSRHSVRTTFFATNSIFLAAPELIEKIHRNNHEIAFHGFTHNDAAPLGDQIDKSRDFLAKYGAKGFRAPEMGFSDDLAEILAGRGFKYDSSRYGGSPSRFSCSAGQQSAFMEIPVSCWPADKTQKSFTAALRNLRIPFGSGLMLSMLPSSCISRFIRKLNNNSLPAILFIHQWQFVKRGRLLSLMRLAGKFSGKTAGSLKLRDIYSLAGVPASRVENLLTQHPFGRMDELLDGRK